MANDADIIARLTLNAREFAQGFDRAIADVTAKGRRAGGQIGESLGGSLGDGLRQTASRIPLLGNALSGLSGAGLVAAAGLGAATAAMTIGIREAEAFEKATRSLNAVLQLTDGRTGFSADQLISRAEELETLLAIPAEEIIGAQRALAQFDGIAGGLFDRTIDAAADLAATFQSDIGTEAQKLGNVLQNLASGEVDGLSKAFKFLGRPTLDTIENLAKTGREAEAMALLLDRINGKIGNSAEVGGVGLSAAFFRLGDAVDDAFRAMATGLDANTRLTTWIDGLATKVNELAEEVDNFDERKWLQILGAGIIGGVGGLAAGGPIGAVVGAGIGATSGAAALANDQANEFRVTPRQPNNGTRFDPKSGKFTSPDLSKAEQDRAQAAEQARAKAEGERSRAAAAALDAEKKRTAELDRQKQQRQAEAQRVAETYERTLAQLQSEGQIIDLRLAGGEKQAEVEAALVRLREQLRGVSAADLAIAEQLVRVNVQKQQQLEEQKKTADAARKAAEDAVREQERAYQEQLRQQEQDVRDLSQAFYEGFLTAGTSFWDQFSILGKRALAELAAAAILGVEPDGDRGGALLGAILGDKKKPKAGGGMADLESDIDRALAKAGGSNEPTFGKEFSKGFKSVFTDLKKDGKDLFKSIGVDFDEVGGKFAGIGDTLGKAAGGAAIGTAVAGGAKALGLPSSKTGGQIGGAIGSALPIPGGEIIGSIIGSTIGGLLKKVPKATSALSTDSLGEVEAGKGVGSKSLREAAEAVGKSFAARLQQIADAIDADIRGELSLGTIGQKGKKFTFDADGPGGAKAQKFKTEDQAVAAALKNAIATKEAFTNISATGTRLLRGADDIEKALNQVAAIESIPKRIRAIEDPTGAALDDLNEQFDKLRKTLGEAGASTQELAQLEKLFGLERMQVLRDQAETLKSFRDSLMVGGSSPLSLRDQKGTAEATFAAFERDIVAGKGIDQSAFVEAGRKLLDVERQLNGSTAGFFDQFERVRSLTEKAIAQVPNAAAINPLEKKTADATSATADNTSLMAERLAALTPDAIGRAITEQLKIESPSFIGGGNRGFVRDARVA